MKERIYSIDSLRGIACFVIAFIWHYLNMQSDHMKMPLQSIFDINYRYGQFFVESFFMISGFVMAYCYKRKISEGEDFFLYLKKRVQHLYPLFFITLMYMLVFQVFYKALTGGYYVYKVSAWHFVLNLLCIHNGWIMTDQSFNGPAWCISVELFLYILFYISTKISKDDNNLYIVISGIVAIIGSAFVYFDRVNYPIFNTFMMRGVSCFYIGVILCELNDRIAEESKKKSADLLLIFLVVFRCVLYFCDYYSFWENESTGRMMLILFQWPILIFAAVNSPLFRKVLEIKPLRYMGEISMDIFLWHIPVQITIKTINVLLGLNLDYGSAYVWLVYCCLVLAVSVISHIVSKKITKHNYFLQGVVAFACCAVILVVTDITGIQMKAIVNNSLSYDDKKEAVELQPGVNLEEDFSVSRETFLKKIQFYTITWHKEFADDQVLTITVRDKETNEEIYQSDRALNCFSDGNYYDMQVEEPVLLEKGMYTITYETNTASGQEVMALLTTDVSNNSEPTYMNDNEIGAHISQKIYTQKM